MSVNWVAVDWGTSNLRIWAMNAADEIVHEIRSDQGMATLSPHEFEQVLLSHIEPWIMQKKLLVVACGMVGSRQGWFEAPYAFAPIEPAAKWVKAHCNDPRIDLRILSGIAQSCPADVMRGEETQIAGFLAIDPKFEGAICLPGTHSKWALISDGKIQKFQTALTGELFALLTQKSVLRHSLGTWNDDGFIEAVNQSFNEPEALAMRFFNIRAQGLLDDDRFGVSRLSGALIGAELSATRNYWQDKDVCIIGAGELGRLYGLALQTQVVSPRVIKASTLTLKGLTKIKNEVFNA